MRLSARGSRTVPIRGDTNLLTTNISPDLSDCAIANCTIGATGQSDRRALTAECSENGNRDTWRRRMSWILPTVINRWSKKYAGKATARYRNSEPKRTRQLESAISRQGRTTTSEMMTIAARDSAGYLHAPLQARIFTAVNLIASQVENRSSIICGPLRSLASRVYCRCQLAPDLLKCAGTSASIPDLDSYQRDLCGVGGRLVGKRRVIPDLIPQPSGPTSVLLHQYRTPTNTLIGWLPTLSS